MFQCIGPEKSPETCKKDPRYSDHKACRLKDLGKKNCQKKSKNLFKKTSKKIVTVFQA
jgi:hypothetical protein